MFDSRKEKELFKPVITDQQSFEVVSSFESLGTIVDSKLSFGDNVYSVYKKVQECLGVLRNVRSFGVSNYVVESVYRCLMEGLFILNLVSWYGNLSVQNRVRQARVVHTASKIVGSSKSSSVACSISLSEENHSLSSTTKRIL